MPSTNPNNPPRRRQSDRSAETRRKLLDAAVASLVENGFAGTTVDAIATAAGVTRGALHHHFDGKIDLMLAAANQVTEHFSGRLVDRLDRLGEADPYEGVLRALWEAIYGEPVFVARIELLLGARSQPEILTMTKAELVRGHERVHAVLAAAFERSGLSGAMPQEVVDLALSTLRGMALEAIVREDEAFIGRQLRLLADALRGLPKARRAGGA